MSDDGAGTAEALLVVVAHPALERSRANRTMMHAAEEIPGVTVHDLYETYPDLLIDVEAEQKRLVSHRNIVLQFPLYWYSTPALLKSWIDEVWLHGFAYGKGGVALKGKTLLVACSAGSPVKDYRPDGAHFYGVTEFLRPLERTAILCRMSWAEPFVLHESRVASSAKLADEVERYVATLLALARVPA
jgi:glutathione-regulated potassium-efflux system ancillary protein KefG